NLFLRHLPQNPDKLLEGGGDARSQIENPAASAMQGADVGLGDIPHIDKIPGLLSVAEDRQGLFPEHPVEENGDHAALAPRILSNPVNIGVAENRVIQPVQL